VFEQTRPSTMSATNTEVETGDLVQAEAAGKPSGCADGHFPSSPLDFEGPIPSELFRAERERQRGSVGAGA
jgi:hypothetical protein